VTSALVDPPRTDARAGDVMTVRPRALSRAGAIAVVLAARPTPRLLRQSVRVGLLVGGSLVIAAGVALMLWTGLGPGPLDVFIGAVRVRTGLPLTLAVWLVIATLVVASWAMGRRPGFGTLAAPLITGPAMQVSLSLLGAFEPPDAVVVALAVHVTAVFVVGLGAGALIVSGLGAGSGELLAAAAADRSGRAEPRVRMAFELSWLLVGVALGGPIGLGTVVVALTIGPAVAVGHRALDRGVVSCRTRFAAVPGTDSVAVPLEPAPGRSTGCLRRS
jgi:uncharacterized membrane protein YczE